MSECCNDIKIIAPDGIDVRGVGSIVVTPTQEEGKKVFIVEYVAYVGPVINHTPNPIMEVGEEIDFTWEVNFQDGRDPIVSRSLVPSEDVNLYEPFTLTVEDQKKTNRGTQVYYTLSASDNLTSVSKNLSIHYVNKVFRGYSYKDGTTAGQQLTQEDILGFTGTLADNILSVYGGQQNYTLPTLGSLQYIYWIYEAGTTPISVVELSGLTFPVIQIPGSVEITNPHDNTISTNYSIVRSANKFGNGTLSLLVK
jgi:hypothetical protein